MTIPNTGAICICSFVLVFCSCLVTLYMWPDCISVAVRTQSPCFKLNAAVADFPTAHLDSKKILFAMSINLTCFLDLKLAKFTAFFGKMPVHKIRSKIHLNSRLEWEATVYIKVFDVIYAYKGDIHSLYQLYTLVPPIKTCFVGRNEHNKVDVND